MVHVENVGCSCRY